MWGHLQVALLMYVNPESPDTDSDFPFRRGPGFLGGVAVFVAVNVFVYLATGQIGWALAIGFALWLVAVVLTRLFAR